MTLQDHADNPTEKPTPKSIQERLTKLRHEQLGVIEEMGLTNPPYGIVEVEGEEDDALGPTESPGLAGTSGSSTLAGTPLFKSSIANTTISDEDSVAADTLLEIVASTPDVATKPISKKRKQSSDAASDLLDAKYPRGKSSDKRRRTDPAPDETAASRPGFGTAPPAGPLIPLDVLVAAAAQAKTNTERNMREKVAAWEDEAVSKGAKKDENA